MSPTEIARKSWHSRGALPALRYPLPQHLRCLLISGAWVFRGTRIPVAALFENLGDGVPLAECVAIVPGVTPEQARSVLEHAARSTAAAVA